MNIQKLSSKAFETIHCINDVFNKRLSEVKNSFNMDKDIYEVTCMEWVQMLQKYILILIELINDLFCEAASRVDKLERKNNFYALQLQLSKTDCYSKDYCSESFPSKSNSEAEKRLSALQEEEQSYIAILNREINALVEICGVQNKNMKLKEAQFSCQKDKIVKLVKSLMKRISIGHQRLSKFISAVICLNELLSKDTKVRESDSSICNDLRSKVLEMRAENLCLKDQIQILQSAACEKDPKVHTDRCFSQRCSDMNQEILKLECDLKMKNERVERLRENNAHLQKELKKANCKCVKLENRLRDEPEKATSLIKENCKLSETLEHLREEEAAQIDNLSQRLYAKSAEICTLKEDNAALCESLKSANYNAVKYETLLKIHGKTEENLRCLKEDMELDRNSHEQEVCLLEDMVNEKDTALKTLRESLESKNTEFACLRRNLSDIEKAFDNAREQLQVCQDLLCKSQAANEEQKNENDDLKDEISELNSRISTLNSCVETLKTQLKESRANSPMRQQNNSLQCEISSLKSTIFDQNKTNETLKLRVENFKEDIQNMSDFNKSQKEDICSLKDKLLKQVTRSNETVRKFNQLVKDYHEIQEDHKRIIYKLECATRTAEIHEQKEAAATKKIRHLQDHLQCVVVSDKEQLIALNCELERKNHVLCKENEKLMAANCDLENKNQAFLRKLNQCCCNF